MDKNTEHLIEKIRRLIPDQLPGDDLEKNIRALISSHFSKLGLVTKEEFEAQTSVLARTREKLERLELQLNELASAD